MYIFYFIYVTLAFSKTSTASSSSKMFPGAERICKILFSTSNSALAFSAPSTINFCLLNSKSGLIFKLTLGGIKYNNVLLI